MGSVAVLPIHFIAIACNLSCLQNPCRSTTVSKRVIKHQRFGLRDAENTGIPKKGQELKSESGQNRLDLVLNQRGIKLSAPLKKLGHAVEHIIRINQRMLVVRQKSPHTYEASGIEKKDMKNKDYEKPWGSFTNVKLCSLTISHGDPF